MAALDRFNPYFNYIDLSLGAEDQCDCEGEEAGNYENIYDEKEVATPSYQAEENQPEQLKEEEQIVQSPIENQAKEEEREEIEPPAPEPRIEEEEKKKKKERERKGKRSLST